MYCSQHDPEVNSSQAISEIDFDDILVSMRRNVIYYHSSPLREFWVK